MDVLVGDRRSGRTTALIHWLAQGEKRDGYPFWSRVVLVPTVAQAQLIHDELRERYGHLDAMSQPDWYRWVFTVDEWGKAYLGTRDVEVAIDNADHVLQELVRRPLAMVTLEGQAREIKQVVLPAGTRT